MKDTTYITSYDWNSLSEEERRGFVSYLNFMGYPTKMIYGDCDPDRVVTFSLNMNLIFMLEYSLIAEDERLPLHEIRKLIRLALV